jgi:protein-tyrosine sulfotransferase
MVDTTGNNLVFLLSTPRSGSTLTSAILENNDELLCPNEPWFLLGLAALYLGGNITYARYEHSGVEQALREFLSESEFLQTTRAFAVSAYNQRLQTGNRRIFVDKTPRYFHIMGFIEELFPDAKKIWLKRNPLDVVASYHTSWEITVDQLFDPEFGPMALDLPLGLNEFSTFFRGQPNSLEIRYEDIVQRPSAAVEELCNFLGVNYQSGMEIYGTNTAKLAERKSKRMGDSKLFADVQPHSRSIGQWRNVLNHEQIQKVLSCLGSRIFERMGYREMIPELLAEGFYFPDDQTVQGHLSAFRNASKWLPWACKNHGR